MLVYLRLDSLPSLFAFITLLSPQTDPATAKDPVEAADSVEDTGEGSKSTPNPVTSISSRKQKPLEVHGLRLIELTDRTSSVMQVTEDLSEDLYSQRDPVINTFRTFSSLSPMSNNVAVSGRVAVVPESSYAETLTSHAADTASEFALIPWSEYGSLSDFDQPTLSLGGDRFKGNAPHLEFIHKTLHKAEKVCNAGVFIDNGFGGFGPRPSQPGGLTRSKSGVSLHSQHHRTPALATYPTITDRTHHIFLPFIGGADDRVALRLVLQLARNANVTATVVHLKFTHSNTENDEDEDATLLSTLRDSLSADVASRITFTESNLTEGKNSNSLAETVLGLAKVTVGQKRGGAGDVVVVGRRHVGAGDKEIGGATSATAASSRVDVSAGSSSANGGLVTLGKTVGVVAEGLVGALSTAAGASTGASGKGEKVVVNASVLVVQAGGRK